MPPATAVLLYWIPLGAGGSGFVRFNGRVYEAIRALVERRPRRDLYHTALEVRVPDGRYVIETMWPSPDHRTSDRGVVVEGPVFARWLSSNRVFRYEVRCWLDGVLPDAGEAVGGARLVSDDEILARRLISSTEGVPSLTWGRDPIGAGDMWNSNSVISWLLATAGVAMGKVQPPEGGRAPGWGAGILAARKAEAVRPTLRSHDS